MFNGYADEVASLYAGHGPEDQLLMGLTLRASDGVERILGWGIYVVGLVPAAVYFTMVPAAVLAPIRCGPSSRRSASGRCAF